MNRRKLFRFLLFSTCLILANSAPVFSSTRPASAPSLGPKQIAAPPDEVLNGNLTLPEPVQAGIRSHWAMLPVNLEQAPDGSWNWEADLPVGNAEEFSLMLLSPNSHNWEVSATSPDQTTLNLNQADPLPGIAHTTGQLSAGDAGFSGDVFTFTGQAPGQWKLHLKAASDGLAASGGEQPDGYVVLSDQKSSYRLFTHLNSYDLRVGNEVGLVASVYDDTLNAEGNLPAAIPNLVAEAEMRLRLPDGQALTLPMADDGRHADGAAGDGVFGSLVKVQQAGDYTAQVTVRGQTPDGQIFLRTSEHIFPVINFNLTLTGAALAKAQDAFNLRIPLQGIAPQGLPELVQVGAEVWGTSAQGTAVPIAWIGGMVAPHTTSGGRVVLPINLDVRWIALAGARAPFELRQVRVQDPATHIPVARLETVALRVRSLPKAAQNAVASVTPEMLHGARPEASTTTSSVGTAAYVGGHKLLLVHGYCSDGNPWPTTDFTNYAVFSDYGNNRSHDQFARLIRDFGAQYDSFGGVGHSQGGAALLHLYTYYWSGLDWSSGSRLIQSLGTPYQGTSLAGNLALLGQIFGIGCGTNWDLSYDGARLWLSGIPSWARSRLYYWTTSFEDVWWRYDYCNIASDVFLDDPDDGVVERWAGQVSGANNMGHKTGQCHVGTGMRDPAQYLDHGRNAQINTYGNR